jgi:hypothetical protein
MTRRAAAAAVGALLGAAVLWSACESTSRETAGAYELRRTRASFGGHTSTSTDLFCHGQRLAANVSDWALDPSHGPRIVFATDDPHGPTGTFLHDAASGVTRRLDARAVTFGSAAGRADPGTARYAPAETWAPDGRHLVLGDDVARPRVVDLQTLAAIDLTDAVTKDGRRIEMRTSAWAPDGDALAVILEPEGYNGDRDLVAITPSTLAVRYVGSMRGSLPLWTRDDHQWAGADLVAATAGRHGPIFVKAAGELTWTAGRPR